MKMTSKRKEIGRGGRRKEQGGDDEKEKYEGIEYGEDEKEEHRNKGS